MAPTLGAGNYIYEGCWVNWSRGGRVLGSTLTLNPQRAAILSSAITITITIAGTQLWYLFRFALHQSRTTLQIRNFMYHQSQTILRNTSSDIDALKQLIRLAVAWRHQRGARTCRTLAPLILLAAVHFVLIIVIGVLSSWLLDAGNDVLSISPWCGNYDSSYYKDVSATTYQSNASAVMLATEYNTYSYSRFVLVQQTVDICGADRQNCHGPRPDPTRFTSQFIPNVCPVADAVCHPEAGGSMFFDTGLISSRRDLGYNSPEADQVHVRLQAQCAPLKPDGFVTGWQEVLDGSSPFPRQLCDAKYGVSNVNQRNATASIAKQNWTCDETLTRTSSLLMPYYAFPGSDGKLRASFKPIAQLYPTNADLSLVIASYQNAYSQPITDPWFSAQQPVNLTNSSCLFHNIQAYTREYPLTAMVCTQKWQFCNQQSTGRLNCTDASGIYQLAANLSSTSPQIVLSKRQEAIKNRILYAAVHSSFYYAVYALSQASSPPLKVRRMIQSATLPRVGPTQWRNETAYWMELVIAYFRRVNLDYSTGEFAASTDYINVTRPATSQSPNPAQDATYWLCQNQMISSKEYRNFNFFAFCLIAALCILIILLGWFVEDIAGYLRTRSFRFRTVNQKHEMWDANNDLSMLRRIDELQSHTRWTTSRNGLPVTHIGHAISVGELMPNRHNAMAGGIHLTKSKRRGNTPYMHQDLAVNDSRRYGRFVRSSDDTGQYSELSQTRTSSRDRSQASFAFENDIPNSREAFFRPDRGLLIP